MMISSPHMLRRFCCFTTVVASSSSNTQKKRLVFMGSPQVSASVLDNLLTASSAPDSFEISAIVTQPPSGRDRGRKVMPSPVAPHALDKGFSPDLIFTPLKASEEMFLSSLKALEPDLCITAAYGNILPTKFLMIPSMGTVNIHPSLLPLAQLLFKELYRLVDIPLWRRNSVGGDNLIHVSPNKDRFAKFTEHIYALLRTYNNQ